MFLASDRRLVLVFVVFWLVLLLREKENFMHLAKNIKSYCIYKFQHTKLNSFQNLSHGFILRIFLKFRKYQPQYATFVDDVVVVWPGSCNNVASGHAQKYDFQYPTCRSTLQQGARGQTHATVLRLTMLQYVAFNCCDRLAGACKYWANNVGICWNVVIVWLGLKWHSSAPGSVHG